MTLRRSVRFPRLLRALREHCPPLLPVRVRRCRMPPAADAWADCDVKTDEDGKPSHFLIRIDRTLTEPSLSDAIVHEWAHTLTGVIHLPFVPHHGREWGRAMELVYSVHEGLRA